MRPHHKFSPLDLADALPLEPEARTKVRAPSGAAGELLRLRARTLAESVPPGLRLACAQGFVGEVARRYWAMQPFRASRPIRPSPALGSKLDREGLLTAEEAATHAVGLDADSASYFVGRLYTAMLPEDQRSEFGVYYTPPAVAARLIESATSAGRLSWESCRVLDPACGGGAFLAPVARRMLLELEGLDRRVVLANLAARLRGFEVDPFAAWLSRVFLDVTIGAALGSPPPLTFDVVTVCDSLTQEAAAGYDLVIGNPPYGRVVLSSKQRERFERSLYGHANLYGLFLDLALQYAKPDSVIAYVTPTGFLCGEYFKRLRSTLAVAAPPRHLEFLSEREGVFDDVLQEALLAIFCAGVPATPAKVTFAAGSSDALKITFGGEAPLPPDASAPWIVARSPESKGLAVRLRRMTHRLSDWGYTVSTGPLVWNRYKDQLLQKKTEGAVPLIWAEAVGADGVFSFRSTRRNHAPYFLPRSKDAAVLVNKPCVLLQRTTAKEQVRRLIAAEMPQSFIDAHGGVVTVENHLNMFRSLTPTPPVSVAVLAAFLNSGAADRAFRCISGTVAVSAYELESLPLPPPAEVERLSTQLAPGFGLEAAFTRLYGEP